MFALLIQSYKLFRRAVNNNRGAIYSNLAFAIVLEILSVALLYVLNATYGSLYAGIQAYNNPLIWSSIRNFTGLALVLVGVNGYMGYFINKLAFAIREGLTLSVLGNLPNIINIDQRIQEDLKRFGESACEFWFAVLRAGLHIPVFIGVILTLTSPIVAGSIIAAVVAGTIVTRLVARRLVLTQSIQETNEAFFRTSLRSGYPARYIPAFFDIKSTFQVLNSLFKRLSFTQSGLSQVFVLLPFMVLMPLYLAKTITMGAFFQSNNALGKVIDSLSVLIDSRQVMVNIETCLVRLAFMTEDVV